MRTQQDNSILQTGKQDAPAVAQHVAEQLESLLLPLLHHLDLLLDKRLVRTFLTTLQVIVHFSNHPAGDCAVSQPPSGSAPFRTWRLHLGA